MMNFRCQTASPIKVIKMFDAKEKNYRQFVGTNLPLSTWFSYFNRVFHSFSAKFRRDKNSAQFNFKKVVNIATEKFPL